MDKWTNARTNEWTNGPNQEAYILLERPPAFSLRSARSLLRFSSRVSLAREFASESASPSPSFHFVCTHSGQHALQTRAFLISHFAHFALESRSI